MTNHPEKPEKKLETPANETASLTPSTLSLPHSVPIPSIPGYEIVKEINRGGMGIVYLAKKSQLGLLVALKVMLRGEASTADELTRFHREARAVARLDHPNIVRIFDFGEHDGCPFFTMEYVAGGSLKNLLGERPLAPSLAAEIVETLASAMHSAHLQGVVHRDLKPANVLLKSDSVVSLTQVSETEHVTFRSALKIADFGLAKRLFTGEASDNLSTENGAVLGTPPYMAPEQAKGLVREIDARTDVYALGAVLYELLTGKPPFEGQLLWSILYQVIHDEPVAPSHRNRDVPVILESICLHCLEKEKANRYPTAKDLADDLRRFRSGDSVSIQSVDEQQRHHKWARQAGYEIKELLGVGRDGYVYRAWQPSIDRPCVITIPIVHEGFDQIQMERIKEEARLLARLRHPGIVQIRDLVDQVGRPLLVTDYIDGPNLVTKFQDTLVPILDAVRLVESLARACHYAHEKGIIHRNLKPGNILVAADGEPKLTGFKFNAELRQDRLLGSYRAPELLRGEPPHRSMDIYSLGAVLYKLLTGVPPHFTDDLKATRRQSMEDPPTPPHVLRDDIPRSLEDICLTCLEKDPADRYSTAEALADDLRLFLDRAASPLFSASKPSPGRLSFPGYELLGRVSESRMSIGYQARHVESGRVVFLRTIEPWAEASPSQKAKFIESARAFQVLSHPHIGQLLEIGQHEGFLFMVQEFLSGGTLTSKLRDGPMSIDSVIELGQVLGDALGHAHLKGLIHGDVRPGNVLFTESGEPKITDFGLSQQMDEDLAQTRAGVLMGTPTYMSPEQANGNRAEIGPASDVYATGVILYELLTCKAPFTGNNFLTMIYMTINSPPPLPRQLRPEIPVALERICLRCLEKEPRKRFANGTELASELRSLSKGFGPTVGIWTRVRHWLRLS